MWDKEKFRLHFETTIKRNGTETNDDIYQPKVQERSF